MRRFRRMQRRRNVARAYDMALEIARVLPKSAKVLDVGCGNGFIAHHLTSILRSTVVGLDVHHTISAPIEFVLFDGQRIPLANRSADAVLLCYVLHHARDPLLILDEVARVLRPGGLAIVYEDIPRGWWDRQVCRSHNFKWQRRTGPCTFRLQEHWGACFRSAGFEIMRERRLSRWRNMGHPVSRHFYVLAKTNSPTTLGYDRTSFEDSVVKEEICAVV